MRWRTGWSELRLGGGGAAAAAGGPSDIIARIVADALYPQLGQTLVIDNRAGAAAATRYLLGLGHRTVYHVAGPANCLDARERVDGWRQAQTEGVADRPAGREC